MASKKLKPFDVFAWLNTAVSPDTYRPILCGVYRDAEEDMFVSTDTHHMLIARVAKYDQPLEDTWTPGTIKVLDTKLQKSLGADTVEGTYPNWRRVIPFNLDGSIRVKSKEDTYGAEAKEWCVEITVDAYTFATLLEGLKTAAKNNANRVRFTPDSLRSSDDPIRWSMLAKTLDEDAGVEFSGKFHCDVKLINCEGKERPITEDEFQGRFPVAFNVNLLLDALKGINLGSNVTMRFWANSRAMQINYEAHPNLAAVVMPMAAY